MNGNMHTNGFKTEPLPAASCRPLRMGGSWKWTEAKRFYRGVQLEVAVSAKPPLQYGKNPVTELPEGAPELPEW